jgi:tetratricopeptide (TPR) repeat protein
MRYQNSLKLGWILFLLISIFWSCQDDAPEASFSSEDNAVKKVVDSLNSVSFKLLRKDLSQSIQLSTKADSISRIHNYYAGLTRSLRSQAYYHYYVQSSATALQKLREAEQIEKQNGSVKGLVATYNTQAFVLKKNGLYADASELYRKVMATSDSTVSRKSRIASYNNLANIFTITSQYDSAVTYYNRLIVDFNSVEKDSSLLSVVYTNMANTQSLMKNYPSAKENYLIALSYCRQADAR